MLDLGLFLQFSFGELVDLNGSIGFGMLSTQKKLGSVRDPFNFVRRVIDAFAEMLNHLRRV